MYATGRDPGRKKSGNASERKGIEEDGSPDPARILSGDDGTPEIRPIESASSSSDAPFSYLTSLAVCLSHSLAINRRNTSRHAPPPACVPPEASPVPTLANASSSELSASLGSDTSQKLELTAGASTSVPDPPVATPDIAHAPPRSAPPSASDIAASATTSIPAHASIPAKPFAFVPAAHSPAKYPFAPTLLLARGVSPAKYSCARISSGDARRLGSKVNIRSSKSTACSPALPIANRRRMFPGLPRTPRRYRRQRSEDTASTSCQEGVPMTSKKRLSRARTRLSRTRSRALRISASSVRVSFSPKLKAPRRRSAERVSSRSRASLLAR